MVVVVGIDMEGREQGEHGRVGYGTMREEWGVWWASTERDI